MSLEAKLGLDKGAFDAGLAGASKQLSNFVGSMQGIGGALAGAGLTAFIEKVISAGDEIGDLGQRFKVSTDDLQRFSTAGELSGTSLEAVAKGLAKIQASGRSASYMYELADAVAAASSENEAFAIVSAVVGDKLASQLLPMLQLGGAEMRRLGESAAVMSADTVAALSEIDDSMVRLKKDLTAGGAVIVANVGMPLIKIIQTIATNWAVGINTMINMWGVLTDAIKKALSGDFSGAGKDLLKNAFIEMKNAKTTWKESVKDIWNDPKQEPASSRPQETDFSGNRDRGKSSGAAAGNDKYRKGNESAIAAQKKKEEDMVNEIAALKKKRAEEGMTLEERLAAKKAEVEAAVTGAADARRYDERLAFEVKALKLAEEYRDIQTEINEKRKESLKEIAEKEKELAAARAESEKASEAMRTASLDRAATSLGDLAAGTVGGLRSQRDARNVQRLEERARRRKAAGDDAGALEALGQADAARQKIAGLSSSDKNPMKGMEDAIAKQTEKTAEISKTLDGLKQAIGA